MQVLFLGNFSHLLGHRPARLTSCLPRCSPSARGLAENPASLSDSILPVVVAMGTAGCFPSKPGGALRHIKQHCHESVSSTTGSLTIAQLAAYAAAFLDCGFLLDPVGEAILFCL